MSDAAAETRLERELFVRSVLPELHGDAAARLAAVLEPRDVPAETWLFRAGEPSAEFFFIVEGHVSMELEGHAPWTFGARSMVGMIDMNLRRPHRRGCRTTRATRVLVGNARVWTDMAEDDPLLGNTALQAMSVQLHALWREHGYLLPPEPTVRRVASERPLPLYEKVLALRDTGLFRRAGTQALASLAQVAEELEFGAEAEVFAVGHAERTLYVVVEGLIELAFLDAEASVAAPATPGQREPNSLRHVVRFGPLHVLAPAAAMCGQLGAYSARALEASVLLRIRDDDYYDQAEEHPDLIRAALAYLVTERERLMDLVPPVG